MSLTLSRRDLKITGGLFLSGLRLTPESPEAEMRPTVFLHGYGGCKEEVVGLALRVAQETGRTGYLFDLPGHGESGGEFSPESVAATRRTIEEELAPIAGLGHSIGARIALTLAGTVAALALSPPLRAEFDGDKTKLFRTLRQRRVRERSPFGGLVALLEELGEDLRGPGRHPGSAAAILVVTAANDLPAVKESAKAWRGFDGVTAIEDVVGASHLDIVTSSEVMAAAPAWVAEQLRRERPGRAPR